MSTGSHRRRNRPAVPAPSRPDAVKRPIVPAVPSESAVGEEDPGDFESASIRRDDGHRDPVSKPPRGR